MRAGCVVAVIAAVAAAAGLCATPGKPPAPPVRPHDVVSGPRPRTTSCPPERFVDIPANSPIDQRWVLKHELQVPGTTVRLGPGVDLDFSTFPIDSLPLRLSRCVMLTSVEKFDDGGVILLKAAATGGVTPTIAEGRSASVPGPILRYGKSRGDPKRARFLDITCSAGVTPDDGVRISGFRLIGPSFGQQDTFEKGIAIFRCIDIDISNMEIAGWGGTAVEIDDDPGDDTAGTENAAGGRISNVEQITIHDSWIHNNQHPQKDGQAEGYGVGVHHGAWAHVFQNAFDNNRHSVEAEGDAGGYDAEHNLVLKGGGYHGKWYNSYTHVFDVHGTGCWWSDNLCGEAGLEFHYIGNAFLYHNDSAIKIRGKAKRRITIDDNVFPHADLEGDIGDDATTFNTLENVLFGPGNITEFDSFGRYGVCDFDGDGVDDLFLPTGKTWWFSSFGEFQWTFLSAKPQRMPEVALAYIDSDLRCDVVAQIGEHWAFSSGGTGPWTTIGFFGVELKNVVLGRFDPNIRDHRPGVTRRTTHAFRRDSDGQWFVTPLTAPDWQPVQSSARSMDELRFGDFTGDGVTDVLAIDRGRWAISESARGSWTRLNSDLNDPVRNLFIANMDPDDNIDDILKLDVQSTRTSFFGTTYIVTRAKWYRSKNGRGSWELWKSYEFRYPAAPEFVGGGQGFVGRFGVAPGGGTMLIGPDRFGRFHSKAEIAVGAAPDWLSVFAY